MPETIDGDKENVFGARSVNSDHENSLADFIDRLKMQGVDVEALFQNSKTFTMDMAQLGALLGGLFDRLGRKQATITIKIANPPNPRPPAESEDWGELSFVSPYGSNKLKQVRNQFIAHLVKKGVPAKVIAQSLRLQLRFVNKMVKKMKAGGDITNITEDDGKNSIMRDNPK